MTEQRTRVLALVGSLRERWVSHPAGRSPLRGKPAALAGVSPGPAGTGTAQMHLREVLRSARTPGLMSSVQVPHGGERFDDGDRLVDEDARTALARLLEELLAAARAGAPRRPVPTG